MRYIQRVVIAVFVCLASADAGALRAQTRADSAAVLLNAAEQLRLRGEAGAARAVLELIARQYAGTPAAADVDRLRALLRRMPEAERSGRTELLVWGTTFGAWLGVAAPLALDADEPEGYGVGLLLGAPIGFFAAKQYADAKMPTEGQTRAVTFGGSWGTFQGFALAELLDLGSSTETVCTPGGCFEQESDGDASSYITAAVAGGLIGIGTGAFLARKPISAGTAAAVTLAGLWGSWFGAGLSVAADQDVDEVLASTMIAGNAVLLGAGLVAPRWQMTESRARLISVGGVAGGLAGAGLLLIAQPDGDNELVLVPLTGSVAGLALATHWTRRRDGAEDDGGSRGALINRSGGRWALDTPAASLRLQRAARAESGGMRPAVYVPLVRARF